MKQTDTVSGSHPMWENFTGAISDLLEARKCDNHLTISRELLADMGRFDVEASIEWLQNHGGFCDCEVLMNVECGDPNCDGEDCSGGDA